MSVDQKHSKHLNELKKRALLGAGQFSLWAKNAYNQPEQTYKDIVNKLGHIKVNPPWSVFAEIFNEDTPESIFLDQARFTDLILKQYKIKQNDFIVDAACGTGSFARLIHNIGYTNLLGFDENKEMLEQANKYISPQIKYVKSSIDKLKLNQNAKAIIWYDFSSNYALTKDVLRNWLSSLLSNLETNGILIFDIRVKAGWDVDFFKQKVTLFETRNFQRIWINLPDWKSNIIKFDIFVRTKNKQGNWKWWKREQMIERMWNIEEVIEVANSLKDVEFLNIYDDSFNVIEDISLGTIKLPKFVLKKIN